MLKNFIVLAWRNLIKHRSLSIINLTGLSLSLCFCLLLIFHIRKEYSFDSFHQARGRLFRLEMTSMFPEIDRPKKASWLSDLTRPENEGMGNTFPLIVGRDIEAAFPEVRHAIRFKDFGSDFLRSGQKTLKASDCVYADSSFFLSLSFPLLRGNVVGAFADRSSVILSQTMAKKMFGTTDPIGQRIVLLSDSAHSFVVRGIAANAPNNSGIQFDAVFPVTADPDYQSNIDQGFNQMNHTLLIELKRGVSFPSFAKKLYAWAGQYSIPLLKTWNKAETRKNYQWYMRPFELVHFADRHWGHYTDKKNIYQLSCLVLIVLLIAALNYVLLSVSGATARSQEVGVRKVMGARKSNVIFQFWIETQLLIVIAVLLALVLTVFLLPLFNNLMNAHISFRDFHPGDIVLSMAILAFGLGLLAGYYPALLLARMPAVSVLKSFRTFKINPRFSTALVILQYTACVILMIAAFVVNKQMKYLSERDLGFNKDQVLVVSNPVFDFDFTSRVKGELYQYASKEPFILAWSGMNGGMDGGHNTNGFQLNGQTAWRRQLMVDYGFFEMLKLPLVAGRSFSTSFPTDTVRKTRAAVLNESLFKMLGKTAKLGEYNEPLGETIVGVVKDYNFESLTKKIEPEDHVLLSRGYTSSFLFKIQAGHTAEAIEKLGKAWKMITADYPFEYTFMDQQIAGMYEDDQRWLTIIRFTCFFAVFIACLGLFGLASINAINRVREIGIRKILGAGVADIVGTLSLKFVGWVGVAIVIAIPAAWLLLNKYLEDFAYRVRIEWWLPVAVGGLAMAIAFLTISIQSFRAATANPVDSLRNE